MICSRLTSCLYQSHALECERSRKWCTGEPTLLLAYIGVRAHLHIQSRQWRLGVDRLRVRKTEALLLKVWKGGCIVGIRSVASAPNRIAACVITGVPDTDRIAVGGKTSTSPILQGGRLIFATFRTSTVTESWRGCLRLRSSLAALNGFGRMWADGARGADCLFC